MPQMFLTLRLLNTGMLIKKQIYTRDLITEKVLTLNCRHTIRVVMEQ